MLTDQVTDLRSRRSRARAQREPVFRAGHGNVVVRVNSTRSDFNRGGKWLGKDGGLIGNILRHFK